MIKGIKRPKVNNIAIKKLNPEIQINLHNRFDIEVIDSKTGKIKQKAQAENVICDTLWENLLTSRSTGYFRYIAIGRGSGEPAATDRFLFNKIAYIEASDPIFTHNHEEKWCSYQQRIRLLENQYVGEALTEVGIAYDQILTHAMFRDMNNNIISIYKTDTDIINIYATIFAHYETKYGNNDHILFYGKFINPSLLKSLVGARQISTYSSLITNGGVYPSEVSSSGGGSSIYDQINTAIRVGSSIVYNITNKTIKYKSTRLAQASHNGNHGGFRTIIHTSQSEYFNTIVPEIVIKMDPSWFPGSNIINEILGEGDGETTDFNLKFSYVKSAKIYVNGVEQTSGVTVDLNVPNRITNMGAYFELVPYKYSLDMGMLPGPSNTSNTAHVIQTQNYHYAIYYNPHYDKGIISFVKKYVNVYISNDLETWVLIGNDTSSMVTVTVPVEYQYYKYWKLESKELTRLECHSFLAKDLQPNLVRFAVAPPENAIISADYLSDTIAKDSNHVFDFDFTIYLGEYTP